MSKSNLCNYIGTYLLVNRTLTITGDAGPKSEPTPAITMPTLIQTARQNDERNKQVVFKDCASFTDCISKIINTYIYYIYIYIYIYIFVMLRIIW